MAAERLLRWVVVYSTAARTMRARKTTLMQMPTMTAAPQTSNFALGMEWDETVCVVWWNALLLTGRSRLCTDIP